MAKAGGNYLNSQLSKMEARIDGYAEGIMLDSFGFVSEGSGENLFLVRDGKLYTSTLGVRNSERHHARLGDDTRARSGLSKSSSRRCRARCCIIADELFFTGTAAEITPIRSVDRIPIGAGKPGPITLAIQERVHGDRQRDDSRTAMAG